MTRTENSVKNIKFAIVFQIASNVVAFLVRKIFVVVLTKDYLGLAGTFADILSILSLAELGVGTAVVSSLYRPLAEENEAQLAAIMSLYRRLYRIVGVSVAVIGASLTPFLPYLIHDLPDIPHIELIYLLFVLNASLSYFYVYKQSLIVADQRQYVVTGWRNGFTIIMYIGQAIFLLLTHSYFVYLGIQLVATLMRNITLSKYADKHYPFLLSEHEEALHASTKLEIVRNIRAASVHNLSTVAVSGTDNLLIAYFVGLDTVGVYSNYLMIVSAIKTLYDYLIRAVTASVGDFCVSADREIVRPIFWNIQFFISWLIGFSFVSLAVLLNPFIELWVGTDYLFSEQITLIIAINFYVWGMRKAVLLFWNAYGLYWRSRFKPIAECAVNLAASILLAYRFGIAGILTGTIISTMVTCFWVEPAVLFRHSLGTSPIRFFKDYVLNTIITGIALVATGWACSFVPSTGTGWFVVRALLCVVLSNVIFAAFYCRRAEFKYFVELVRARFALKPTV